MSGNAKTLLLSGVAPALPPTPDPAGIDLSSIAVAEVTAPFNIHEVQWNNNGTWISGLQRGFSSSGLVSWPLSTAYDLTTAGTMVTKYSIPASAGFRWNASGSKLMFKHYSSMLFVEYAASTAFDPSTLASGYTSANAQYSGAAYMCGQAHQSYTGHFTTKPDRNQWYFGVIGDKITMYKSSGGVPTNPAASSTQTSNYMQLNVGQYSLQGGNGNPWGFKCADINHGFMVGRTDRRVSTWDLGIFNELGIVNYSSLKTTSSGIQNINYVLGGNIQNNGTRLYIADNYGNTLKGCTLSTAYDVTTQGTVQTSPSINSQEAYVSNVFFEPGGNYVQYTGSGSDKVWRHYVSSAWDVSTMSSSVSQSSVSLGSSVRSFAYANNGYKLYIVDDSPDTIKQYNCSTAYRPDTASFSTSVDLNSPVLYSPNLYLYDISVSNDGTKLWVLDNGKLNVLGFKMTTAHNVSTIVPDKWHQNITNANGGVRGIEFKSDGTKMIVNEAGFLQQYNLSTAWDVSSHTMGSSTTSLNIGAGYGLAMDSSGTKLAHTKGSANANTKISAQTLSTAWDLSTASAPMPSDAISMVGVAQFKFIKDGTQLYGLVQDSYPYDDHAVIRRWALSTAWDLSTATLQSDTYSPTYGGVGIEGTIDLDVSPDGTVLTFSSNYYDDTYAEKTVRSAVMSTPNNLSTMGSTSQTSAATDIYNYTLAVDGDGGKVYLIGGNYEQFASFSNNGTAYRWSGSQTFTGFDLSSLPVYYPETARFNTSGSKIWVHARNVDRIYAFPLTDYYDVASGNSASNAYVSTTGTLMADFDSFDIGDNDSKFFFLTGGVLYTAALS
tara:strand:+ start:5190 stop:7682 length:2493 start_codon:yes stop_codon:yes gene_type:complete